MPTLPRRHSPAPSGPTDVKQTPHIRRGWGSCRRTPQRGRKDRGSLPRSTTRPTVKNVPPGPRTVLETWVRRFTGVQVVSLRWHVPPRTRGLVGVLLGSRCRTTSPTVRPTSESEVLTPTHTPCRVQNYARGPLNLRVGPNPACPPLTVLDVKSLLSFWEVCIGQDFSWPTNPPALGGQECPFVRPDRSRSFRDVPWTTGVSRDCGTEVDLRSSTPPGGSLDGVW